MPVSQDSRTPTSTSLVLTPYSLPFNGVGLRSGREACLSAEQIRALAALGAKVEAHYEAPQDTEWAIDTSDTLWLTQTRPITTLFPLPPDALTTDDTLRVYFSINVAQGVYRPLTPMGISVFRVMASSIATFLGLPPRDALAGPLLVKEAAYRLFIDVTPALRTPIGRNFVGRVMQVAEARTAVIFQRLATDPRLSLVPVRHLALMRTVLYLLMRSHAPHYLMQAIFHPAAARARVARARTQVHTLSEVPANAGAAERLTKIEKLIVENGARILSGILPVLISALGAYTLASKLLAGLATDDELQTVLRGLPYNPTTEMDLALWALAQRVQADPLAAERIRATPPEQLAQDYRNGTFPPIVQQGLTDFLRTYGHRGVAEIDLGLPRWSEDPTHILGALANYLQLKDPELSPDVQFQRGAQEAAAMVKELTQRARRKGRLHGMFVGFCLRRVRALAGLREAPKFYAVMLIARTRELLWSIGEELARARKIASAADIFFGRCSDSKGASDPRPEWNVGLKELEEINSTRCMFYHI